MDQLDTTSKQDASKQIITFSHYQEIYHQVTKKSETTTKAYSENLKVTFKSIEDLHHRILQIKQTYHIIQENATFTIYSHGKQKEQYTSFERFKLYNSGRPNGTINVTIKYDLLICPHNSTKPYPYAITVNLTSRVGIYEDLYNKDDAFMGQEGFITFMGNQVAEIRVDFVDYVISRAFIQAFDEWVKITDQNYNNKLMTWLKRNISQITSIVGLVMFFPFSYFIYKYLKSHIILNNNDLGWFIYISLITCILYTFIIAGILKYVNRVIENYSEISYVKLTSGDDKIIRKYEIKRSRSIWKFILSSASVIILGIISAELDKIFF